MIVTFYEMNAFFFQLYLSKVEVDIASSLAITDSFSFRLIGFISMTFAILPNLYCLIIKSALRSPVSDFYLEKTVFFIQKQKNLMILLLCDNNKDNKYFWQKFYLKGLILWSMWQFYQT